MPLKLVSDQAEILDIIVTRRNAPEMIFRTQLEMNFALSLLHADEIKQYAGMNFYTVEVSMAKRN